METYPLETFEENLLPTYRGYHVSKTGEVYSRLNRYGANILESFWTKKKICLNKAGYPITMMVKSNGKQRATPIHHLVALAYFGERPSGLYVCHGDGNKTNNHVSNLRYGTPKSNSQDRELHGRTLKGEGLPKSVLKEYQIIEIFNLACTGMAIKEIAKLYAVTPSTISQVIKRNKWKHIEVDLEIIQRAQRHTASGLALSEQDVLDIFKWRSQKISKKHIADYFGIAEKTIRDILNRRIMSFVVVDDELVQVAQKHLNKYSRYSLAQYLKQNPRVDNSCPII